MKPKILQLMMVLLLASLFVSSKQNIADRKSPCRLKCVEAAACSMEGSAETKTQIAEYPLLLAPGNYMFNY